MRWLSLLARRAAWGDQCPLSLCLIGPATPSPAARPFSACVDLTFCLVANTSTTSSEAAPPPYTCSPHLMGPPDALIRRASRGSQRPGPFPPMGPPTFSPATRPSLSSDLPTARLTTDNSSTTRLASTASTPAHRAASREGLYGARHLDFPS